MTPSANNGMASIKYQFNLFVEIFVKPVKTLLKVVQIEVYLAAKGFNNPEKYQNIVGASRILGGNVSA